MKIKFAEQFPEEIHFHAKETLFRERILRGIYGTADKVASQYNFKGLRPNLMDNLPPKIHTIRKQKPEHKEGMRIEFFMDGKKFCKNAKCTGIQELNLDIDRPTGNNTLVKLSVDGNLLGSLRLYAGVIVHMDQEVKKFLINDGIMNPIVFVFLFKEAGNYNIIHWTDKRY